MYRFIDTVSIDVMSVARYHFDREPREERSVDGSEAREVRRKGHFPEIDTDCNNLARKV